VFFQGIDWKALESKSYEAPFKPKVQGDKDLSNIDKGFLGERAVDSPVQK